MAPSRRRAALDGRSRQEPIQEIGQAARTLIDESQASYARINLQIVH